MRHLWRLRPRACLKIALVRPESYYNPESYYLMADLSGMRRLLFTDGQRIEIVIAQAVPGYLEVLDPLGHREEVEP